MDVVLELLGIGAVTALAWVTPRFARPTVPFGVRVPPGRVDDPVVHAVRRRYSLLVIVAGVAVAVAVTVLAGRAPASVGIGATAAIDVGAFLLASRAVRAAKRAGDWYGGVRQAVTADTTLRTDPVRLPWVWVAVTLAVVVASGAVGIVRFPTLPATLGTLRQAGVDAATRVPTTVATAFAPVFLQLGFTVLLLLVTAGALRSRPELDAADPAGSARRYRRYLRATSRALLATGIASNIGLALLALQLWELVAPGPLMTVAVAVPGTLVGIGWIVLWVRFGTSGNRLPAEPGEDVPSRYVQRDDDRFWYLAGTMYANRADRAVLVPRRVGMGWTFNAAHPVTWIVVAALVAIAVLAATGVIHLPSRG